jgi:hypothetical protein
VVPKAVNLDPAALLPGLRRMADRLFVTDLPPVIMLRQEVRSPRVDDPGERAKAEVCRLLAKTHRKPGPIAVGIGSRGIVNHVAIVRGTVAALRSAGWQPFLVPAMGSHGAATAEGQASVLMTYGITEAAVGAPVRATMETVVVGTLPDGTPWHLDRLAAEAGAFMLVGRVKPHTGFTGPVESGPAKMCCVGLGKQAGAQLMHNAGPAGLVRRIPAVARLAEAAGLLVGALAVVENQRDQTAIVAGLSPADVGGAGEEVLLRKARKMMPRLPFASVDVLVIDQMGKDISGSGMDTNVINRFRIVGLEESGEPFITAIAVMRLTEATHGNAMGIGNADFIPATLLGQIDLEALYTNAITAGPMAIERPHLPMVLATGRDAVRAAITACGVPVDRIRLAWIHDTLHTEVIGVSPALQAEHPELAVIRETGALPFGEDGALAPLTQAVFE